MRVPIHRHAGRAAIILCLLLCQGCGTLSTGRGWGQDVTLMPGWSRIGESAYNTATSPEVLIPAAAALLLQIGGADRRLSDWASRHTPVAGSMDRAEELSKDLRSASAYIFYLSILAAPSGDDPETWATSKIKGTAVQGSAVLLGHEMMNVVKETTGRERPNKSDNLSFPSTMSYDAALFTGFAARNVNTMNMPDPAKRGLGVFMHALPYAVAWERVEARQHYPSDVLAGIALGCFTASLFNDSFMGFDGKTDGTPFVRFDGSGVSIGYCWRF